MTLPIPLVTIPGTGTGRDITGHPKPPALLLLALSSTPGPAPAPPPGHHPQSVPPDNHSGLWLRNAAAGLCSWPRPPPRSASPLLADSDIRSV